MLDMIFDPPSRSIVKDWKWIVIDSAVIAGIAFISVMPVDHLPTMFDVYTAVKAFGYAFLVQVATERGFKPWVYKRNNGNNKNGGS